MSVIDFAYEVLEMQQELAELRREVYRLRNIEDQFNTLLNDSLEHSRNMMGGLLKIALVPGVSKALAEHAEASQP